MKNLREWPSALSGIKAVEINTPLSAFGESSIAFIAIDTKPHQIIPVICTTVSDIDFMPYRSCRELPPLVFTYGAQRVCGKVCREDALSYCALIHVFTSL